MPQLKRNDHEKAVWNNADLLGGGMPKSGLMEDREPANGRNAPEERTDTVEVKPSVDANGWEGSVDVGFEFE